jgi:hypothetical protein
MFAVLIAPGCGRWAYEPLDRATDGAADDGRSQAADGTVTDGIDAAMPRPIDASLAAGDGSTSPGPCSLNSCAARQACVSGACVDGRKVFVTAATSNAGFGSFAGADTRCQAVADAAALQGTWMAWLSDDTSAVQVRFAPASVPYYRLDGQAIAADWADLTDGIIANAIAIDEFGGSQLGVLVWTGTSNTGQKTSHNCGNWTNVTAQPPRASVGTSGVANSEWTTAQLSTCDQVDIHLYCFEQ